MSEERANWMTAREAAKRLRVTERMIGHYARDGKLETYREGRRVWYSVVSVENLAAKLQTPLRSTQITRQDVNEEALRSIQKYSEAQQTMLEEQQRQGRTQEDMISRLDRIERLAQPRGPTWQQVALWLGVIGIIAAVVLAYFFWLG